MLHPKAFPRLRFSKYLSPRTARCTVCPAPCRFFSDVLAHLLTSQVVISRTLLVIPCTYLAYHEVCFAYCLYDFPTSTARLIVDHLLVPLPLRLLLTVSPASFRLLMLGASASSQPLDPTFRAFGCLGGDELSLLARAACQFPASMSLVACLSPLLQLSSTRHSSPYCVPVI